MAGNIKLEIIYYETESDAMLEFGLQGNFALRILSARVNNAVELVAALKKASLRNEFIVVVGGFENNAIAGVIAKAIGRAEVPVSQYEPGAEGNEIIVPEGAIPLVNDDGAVCGAVIESGYQSILLLSGEKARRDAVLRPLLLPYLTERYKEIHGLHFNVAEQADEELKPEAEVTQSEESLQQEAEAALSEEILQPEEETPVEIPEITEPILPDPETDEQEPVMQVDDWQDFVFDLPEPVEETPKKKRRVWLILLIVFLSLLLVIGSAFSYLYYFVPWQNTQKTAALAALYEGDGAFADLKEIDSNITAWLKMVDAGINTPVVISADNQSYYRYHLPDGTLNPIGTPYTSEKIGEFTGLYTIYMNGYYEQLGQYLDTDFADNNRWFVFDSATYTARWKVFSAFTFDKDPAFDYLKSDFADAGEYEKQLRILKNASEIGKDESINGEDTVAVFTATRFGKTVVVAARLMAQYESNPSVPTITVPESTSSLITSSDDTSSATSSQTVSKEPVIYSAENNDTKLDDKVDTWQDLPPLTEEQVKDNLATTTKPPVTSTVKPTGPIVTVSNNKVNVRAGAGTKHNKLGQANKDDVFTYLGTEKDGEGTAWYKIQYTAKQIGYISSQFAKTSGVSEVSSAPSSVSSAVSSTVSSSQPSTATGYLVRILGNKVNVRASAGKDGKKLGQVNLWEIFPYISETTVSGYVWYSIQYTDTQVGWVRSDYATKISADEEEDKDDITSGGVTLTFLNNGEVRQGSALDVIASVVEAEMGSGYELEALKAQAVATYSFMLTRGSHNGEAVQVPMKAPSAKALQATKEVLGQCAYYNNSVAQTYYYAISAGYTANCQDIWSSKIPYLTAVESTPDASASKFATQKSFTSAQIIEKINAKYPEVDFNGAAKENWFACTYDDNNIYCTKVVIANQLQMKGTKFYEFLGLRSPAYTVSYDAATDTFTFNVRGYGHGVGMSQVGANGYAKQGWDYKKILQHYYQGVIIK